MKKKFFQGFSENKIENLGVIHGGYYYRGTTTSGSSVENDEDLVTEPSDRSPDCSTRYSCIDETWDDCSPIVSNPGTPPVVPPVRTR